MFESLLVANRGEIACRIFRTCARLGIRTIAVFSDADAEARHLRMADEAVRLGPAPAAESYLRIDRILEAARRTGAAAVHPGYGFLAENAAFAEAVRDAGLVFVGPPPEVMRRLGDKDSAKRLAETAGVPLVPGYHGERQDEAFLAERAREIGFPLLIKAAAGGGGRGMRRVEREEAFAEALAACRREAAAAFGDDRVLLERWIARPRHVEIQVFADAHGHCVHLFERDCTVQRRHQKILEEAPAPDLPGDLHAAICEAAVRLATAAGYRNAGTVEFLLDAEGRFHFIEMNTRLQVEHPVTEMITGTDLVEWQLTVAAGLPLPVGQEAIAARGHAFEARLYAEDPARDFLPATGRIDALDLPVGQEGVRVETGVEAGDLVTSFYDPMIAKIIAWGADREAALARLARALDACLVEGPTTNLDFLRRLARAPALREMRIHTGWLDGTLPELLADDTGDEAILHAALAVIAEREATPPADPSPFARRDGFRLNAPARHTVAFRLDDGPRELVALAEGDGWRISGLGEEPVFARCGRLDAGRFWVERDGRRRPFPARVDDTGVSLVLDGRGMRFAFAGLPDRRGEEGEAHDLFVAPLPGRVVTVAVEAGQRVAEGTVLLVLEAMKMEQKLEAPRDGRIGAVHVRAGDQVEEGTVLLDFEPLEEKG